MRCVVLAVMAWCGASLAAAEDSLEARLRPLIAAHRGDVAVAVRQLESGDEFTHRADEPQPTASLVKFPVLIEVYRQQAEGKLDLDRPVVLRQEDKVPGSGVLTEHFSAGASFPLRDAVRLMIAFSDNTATNLVLDQIGIGSTAECMQRLGCPHTKIHSKVFRRDTSVFPERSEQFGLGSTTAAEMVRLLAALDREELVSREASREMLAHLKACQDDKKFRRFLPARVAIATKTGSVNQVRTAAGILYTKAGPVALCVLTSNNEDQSWTRDNAGDLLCAEIARQVVEFFESREK